MKDKPYILLVDDDPNISRLVQLYLEKEGFEVKTADRGDDALAMFRKLPPDLMLLDVMLPGMDGWQVCRTIRKTSTIPIIMLTAKDETFDKVLGLELGADDYITKPFDTKELVARVKAVLRRTQGPEEEKTDVLSFPMFDLTAGQPPVDERLLDPATHRLPLGDMVISLERATAQAEEYGHSIQRELGYLAVHSVLHLLGYDHMDEGEQKRQMRAREEAIMNEMGVPRE